MKRVWRDAPARIRCKAVIVLKDRSKAQCGRKGKKDSLCWQHLKKQKENVK